MKKTEFDGPGRPLDALMELALRDRDADRERDRARHLEWEAAHPDRVALGELRSAASSLECFWFDEDRRHVLRNWGRATRALEVLLSYIEKPT